MSETHTLDDMFQQDDDKEIVNYVTTEQDTQSLAKYYARRFTFAVLAGIALLIVAVGLWMDAATPAEFTLGGATSVMLLLFLTGIPLVLVGVFGLLSVMSAVLHRNIVRNSR